MVTIQINNNKGKLDGEKKKLIKLQNAFKVKNPGAFFIRKKMGAKSRGWDGKINYITDSFYFSIGLLPMVIQKMKEFKIKYKIVDFRKDLNVKPKVPKIVGGLELRDIQRDCVKAIIENKIDGIPFPTVSIKAATNFGKCIGIDEYIYTDKGIKKALDLYNLDQDVKIINHNDSKVDNIKEHREFVGKIKTLNIELENGQNIIVGYDRHRFLIDGKWVYAKNLKVSDFIQLKKGMDIWGQNNKIGDIKLTNNIAYMLGAIHGDGSVYDSGFGISAKKGDSEIVIEKITDALKDIGIYDFKIKPHKKFNGIRLEKRDYKLKRLLNDVPELINKSYDKEIPRLILNSSKEIICSYIKGLFDTDGSVTKHSVDITLVNKETIKQLQIIFLNLGITCKTEEKKTSWVYKNEKKYSTAYRLRISDYNIKLFEKFIGFNIKYKSDIISNTNDFSNKTSDIISEKLLKDIKEIRAQWGFNCYIKEISRAIRRSTKLSYRIIEEFLIASLSIGIKNSNIHEILQFINSGSHYQKIKSITKGEEYCYDIYIPDGNSFIANGFINHNTLVMAATYIAYRKKIPALVLLNDADLFEQFKKEIPKLLPDVDVRFIRGRKKNDIVHGEFTVAMVQSLSSYLVYHKNHLPKYGILLVDEADLADNTTYKRVIAQCINSVVTVGLSATLYMGKLAKHKPKNMNLKGLFSEIVYEIGKKEMQDKGYSTKIIVKIIKGNQKPGVENSWPDEYKKCITYNKDRAKLCVDRIKHNAKFGRLPALVICKLHEHIDFMYDIFKKELGKKYRIAKVHGDTPDRKKIIERFRAGEIDILIGSYILRRGKNFPLLRYLLNAAGGDSAETVDQILGRLERTHDDKNKALMEDFFDEGFYLKRHSKHRIVYYKQMKLKVNELYK